MKTTTEIVKVLSVERKSTSKLGNPSFCVEFENLSGVKNGCTATNEMFAYGARNFAGGCSCEITYHETRNGKIIIDHMTKPNE